jgi:hydroxyacylglutathione hydrolase
MIAEERATSPFLRAHEASIRTAVERHAGRRLNGAVGVFAELRAWKNSF